MACLALCNRLLMFYFAESAFPPAKERLERSEIKSAAELNLEASTRQLRCLHEMLLTGSLSFDTGEDLEESQNETRPNTRIDFLTRLLRDLPPYYFCHICERLHLWQRVALPSRMFKLPSCSKGLTKLLFLTAPLMPSIYTRYGRHQFYFVHLQLAMRRFYYGPQFGIPVESLFYTEVGVQPLGPPNVWPGLGPQSTQGLDRNYMTILRSFEARICPAPPSLCLRIQEVRVASRKNISRMSSVPGFKGLEVCKHMRSWGSISPEFEWLLASLIDQYRSDPTRKSIVHQQKRCENCNTSWKLEIRDLWENLVCLVSTRWVDLGPGLTPNEARWMHHQGGFHVDLPEDQIVENPRLRFEEDSIQAKSPDALSEEALFCRNTELLKREKYKRVMTPSKGPAWFLLAEEAKKKEPPSLLPREARKQELSSLLPREAKKRECENCAVM